LLPAKESFYSSLCHYGLLRRFKSFSEYPLLDCVSLVQRLLSNCVSLDPFQVEDMVALVFLVLEQNFFQFNDTCYSQTAGLAMGSCLSPLLTEVFMSSVEQSMESYPAFQKNLFFKRYVDDIFCIFDGTMNELRNFFAFINDLDPSIAFTMELESSFPRHSTLQIR